MNTYKRHRFPPEVISCTVWLYYRFNLSHRDIEDLLAERGVTLSRETTRVRGRGMLRFKSMIQAQRFVTAHAAVQNLVNLGRHLVRAKHYRTLREDAFGEWGRAVACYPESGLLGNQRLNLPVPYRRSLGRFPEYVDQRLYMISLDQLRTKGCGQEFFKPNSERILSRLTSNRDRRSSDLTNRVDNAPSRFR